MKARTLIALLLVLALTPVASPVRAQADEDTYQLTQAEQRKFELEAKPLALRFVKRLEETGDVGPLVDEFFLPDFVERFQKFLRAGNLNEEYDLVFVGISRKVLTQADAADLRRVFVVLVNLWHHFDEYSDAVSDVTAARHNLVSVLADDNWRLRNRVLKESLPPAFFDACKSDPLLSMLADSFNEEDESSVEGENEDEDGGDAAMLAKVKAASVQSVERLRSLTEKLEKCVALMREATQKLRDELKAYPDRAAGRTIDVTDAYRVEIVTRGTETLGFPARTPFIHARLFPYVVVMVPVEGQLKVIGVLADFDGD